MTLGSFPSAHVGIKDLSVQFADPEQAEAVNKFACDPAIARARAWSSLVVGPRGSGKTALITYLAKKVMSWEIVNQYSSGNTRAIYFTSRDYLSWLRKIDDFKRTPEEVDYLEGALVGSVLAWDEIDPKFASEDRFVADLKKRVDAQLPVHLVLSQDPNLYAGSSLFEALGVTVSRGQISVSSSNFMPVVLTGSLMTKTGWK